MAALVHPRSIDIDGTIETLNEITIPDRARGPRVVRWLLQIELERILYGDGNGGALYKLLQRNEILNTTLSIDKASVIRGHVTDGEFDSILRTVGSKSARKANLVPTRCAVIAIKSLGDGVKTRALLACLSEPLPRAWELRQQMEADADEKEFDLLAAEELKQEEICNEQQEIGLNAEIAQHFEEFQSNEKDEDDSRFYILTDINSDLKADILSFEGHKTSALNRFRSGAACVDTTFANNKASLLRFLGWFTRYGPNAVSPLRVGTVIGDPSLGEWVQSYLEWLKGRGCMSSSLANYTSGLINTLAWVLSTHEVEDAQGISTGDQLINLRSQLEAQARIDRMYRKRSPNFITWEDVQKTRLAVAKAYADVPPTADRAVKRKALLDLLVVLFHSITPPDRVGVIRRLKFGVTLVKEKPGEWAIDLTKFRHKTSRFYGPVKTTVSSMISPYLDIYCKLMDFDPGATEGYLFCCGDAFERNQPESMWTSTVKKVFKTYSPGHVETPPKLLRSSFITFLRSEERTPELLKSCALGMKHALDTQASDVYDTATHDKLTKCSFDFCESFAKEFEMANGAIPPPPPIPDTLGVPDIVVRSREEATSSPTAVKANAKRLAEGRTAKQGQTQQPVSDALDQLSSLGWSVVEAEGKGDCSILSTIAGYEVKDEKEILNPSASTLKLVSKIRSASVSIVVGSAPIGGLPSKTFRVQEGLAPASQAAAKEMKLWRSNRHWYSENPHESSAFLFGIGLHLDRPIIVLEQGQGGILDPCKIYASRQGDALYREPATRLQPLSGPARFFQKGTDRVSEALIIIKKSHFRRNK